MTSKLKCPFCDAELVGTIGHPICRNQDCVMCDDPMPQDLLEELIRTRKALEIARKALKNMSLGNVPTLPDDETLANAMCNYARDTLKQIEHKE